MRGIPSNYPTGPQRGVKLSKEQPIPGKPKATKTHPCVETVDCPFCPARKGERCYGRKNSPGSFGAWTRPIQSVHARRRIAHDELQAALLDGKVVANFCLMIADKVKP
jgi:hypothetical protein